MNYQIRLKNALGETRLEQPLTNGDVFLIEPGDEVFLIDQYGNPATASLKPDGENLEVIFPDGVIITLEGYFTSAAEGELALLNLAPDSDVSALAGEFEINTDHPKFFQLTVISTGAPEGLIPVAGEEELTNVEFSGGVGGLGSDFSLMRHSDLNFSDFGNSLSGLGSSSSSIGSSGGGSGGAGTGEESELSSESFLPEDSSSDDGSGGTSSTGTGTGTTTAVSGTTPTVAPTGTTTVTPVNSPPEANEGPVTTNEDTPIEIPALTSATDPEGDPITVSGVTSGTNGTVTIDPVSGNPVYTPNPDFNGTDTFTYTITDGQGNTDVATVTVSVTPIADPPDAVDDSIIATEDSPVEIAVLGNDTDPDGDPLTISSLTQGSNGSVAIDLVSGNPVYTPNPNFEGTDTFTYTITDGQGNTDTATVSISVTAVNDQPTAANDPVSTNEDTPVTVDALTNDSDPDGDPLTVSSITQGTNGSVVIDPITGNPVYTPNPNFAGTDTFTYTVTDPSGSTDTATVTVTTNPVNDTPEAIDDSVTVLEDTPLVVNALVNDSDPDGDSLTVTTVTQGGNGTVTIDPGTGNPVYTPNANFTGTDTFSYTIDDGTGTTDTATVTVSVTPVNDSPDAVDDIVTANEDSPTEIAVLGNDSDPENDPLEVTAVTQGSNGTVAIDPVSGNPVYTPNANFNGTDTFTYTIDDGTGATDTATITVNVSPVNDLPEAIDDIATVAEDTPIEVAVLDNDTDIDGDPLTITAVSQGANGTVTIDPVSGNPVYTPNPNFNGTDTFSYTIDDGSGNTQTAQVSVNVTPVNDSPNAVDDTITTNEDIPVEINVQANDSDPEGSAVTITAFTQGTNGSVAIDPLTGHPVYTPNTDFNGTDTFTYTIDDGSGLSDSATVTVNVAPINDAPDAVDDAISVDEDNAVTIPALANDSDTEGDSLSISAVTQGNNGAVTIDPVSGNPVYTPNPNFNGTDTFTYTIEDVNGATDTATITVSVNPVNDAPDAINDTITGDEDLPIEVTVLSNDLEVDGEALSVTAVTQGTNGSVTINPVSGNPVYTSNPNFNGTDTFTYTISDGSGGTDTATVTVNVNAVNDPPEAIDDTITVAEDTPVTIPALTNDSDPEGDPISITAVTQGNDGAVVIDPVSGNPVYTPNANFNGTDTFTYTITDSNGEPDTATIVVSVTPVNDAPDANDDTITSDEDLPIEVVVLGNDSDIDGDALTVTAVSQGSNGTVTIDPVSGNPVYTPTADFNGIDTFTYTIDDGNGGTDTATATVTVNAVNDPPVAVDDAITVAEDTPVTIPALANDSDVEGDLFTLTAVTQGSNGSVTIDPVSGNPVYTPNSNFNGTDTFTYTIDDGNGTTDIGTIVVSVTPVNDPPIALTDTVTTDEDTPISVTVLANDSDIDGDALTISSFSQGSNGTVTVDPLSGNPLYTPNANFNGSDTFTYTIDDGSGSTSTATVSVTVNALNDAPDAVDDTIVTPEDTAVEVSVLDNDSDLEGDPLTITAFTQGNHGVVTVDPISGNPVYTPNPDANGTDTFTYTIDDGNGTTDTATVTVEVTPINDPPVAAADTISADEDTPVEVTVLGNDSDIDGDALFVSAVTHGTNGTVAVNPISGNPVYTPNPNFNGTDEFTYTVDDGFGGSDIATVTVTVNAVNDAPDAIDDVENTLEDTPVEIAVLGNDSDAEGDPISISAVGPASNGTIAIDPVSGNPVYTPNPNFNGFDSFTYTVDDGNGVTDTATVTVHIAAVNDAPDAINDVISVDEDQDVTVPVIDNDSDIENDPLTITSFSQGSNGSVAIDPLSGNPVYTPNTEFNGTDTFTYTIIDGNGGIDTATVTVNVNPVNDVPDAVDDTITAVEDNPVEVSVLGNDTDLDNDLLMVSAVTQGSNGAVTIDPISGNPVYTPNANFNGTDEFTYTIDDSNGGTDTATVSVTVTPVNDSPDAVDDTITVEEDMPVTVAVLGNDSDPENDDVSVVAITQGTNGSVAIDPVSGNPVYTPNANFNGPDQFTYTISDGNGGTDLATVSLNVAPVNDAPDAIDDLITTDEDTTVSIPVLENDSDVESDPITIDSFTQGANGSVVFNAGTGELEYTPNLNFNGTETFTYTVTDGNGGFNTATVTVEVAPINDAPDAVNDITVTDEDFPVTVDVFPNDTDPDNDPLSISAFTNGTNGTVSIDPITGNPVYSPNANFNGNDSFTYTITDPSGLTDTATVNITVNSVNDPPTANGETVATDEDTAISIDVLLNDADPLDGTPVTLDSFQQASNGTVTEDPVSGELIYTPNPDFTGEDSFIYTIRDTGGATDTATATITVNPINDAPDAFDDSITTDEDIPVSIAVRDNDNDVENDPLTISSFTQGTNGVVTVDPVSGNPLYTPNAEYNGPDEFTYTISDGQGGSDTATVSITVVPVNDAPDAVDDNTFTLEDVPIEVDVLFNDSDVEGDLISISGTTDGANGTVSIDPTSGNPVYTPNENFTGVDLFTYTVTDPTGDTDTATVTVTVGATNDPPEAVDDTISTDEDLTVTVPVLDNDSDVELDPLSITSFTQGTNGSVAIDPTSGSPSYTPNSNFNGTDTFTYTITDGNGGIDTATVTVTVNPLNDPPVAIDDTVTVNEDTPVEVTVLANDLDAEGDLLTIDSFTQGANGTVTVDPVSGNPVYTPNSNFTGEDIFTYTITDPSGAVDTASVTITVAPVNDAPDAVNDAIATDEDIAAMVAVLDNDNDIENDALSITATTNGTNGVVTIDPTTGNPVYTPNAEFSGTDSFTYTISDGNLTDTATVNVTVNAVDDAPLAVDDTTTVQEDTPVEIAVLANDSDPEGSPLTITGTSTPANGTVAIDPISGNPVYTPDANFNGDDIFTYTVTDGTGNSSTATVTVTVQPVNDTPDAVNDLATTDEDIPVTVAVLGNDTDPDGDALSVASFSQGTNGTVSVDPVSGNPVYTPNANFTGADSFTYTVSDGNGATDTATVNLTIAAVNDAPIASDDSATVNEDTPIEIAVLANDSDPEGDPVSISAFSQANNGTVALDPVSGNPVYTPNTDFNGTDTFTYTVSDGNGGTDTATVSIDITPVNDAPIATNDSGLTDEDIPITVTVLGNDSDPDGDALSITALTQGNNGSVSVELVSGNPVYTPNSNFNGSDSFTYTVSDGNGGTDTAIVSITVNSLNDAPDAVDDIITTAEDTAVEVGVLGNDSDTDGDPISITAFGQGANGTVTIDPVSGNPVYTPNANFNGDDTFTYSIDDGNGASDTATVTVTVSSVNDVPDAINDVASTDEDIPVTVSVLNNDTDADGDALSITAVTQGSNGSVSIDPVSGNPFYTPNPNFTGSDSFTYTIDDGNGGSDTATVNVNVAAVNDAPDAVDDSISVDEDTPVEVPVLGNDTDLEGDPLTITGFGQGANGTVTIDPVSGNPVYTPNPNFNGSDSFTYTISDGSGGTDTATANVTVNSVNDAPDAVNDIAATDEDIPITLAVLNNDTDPDGDALSIASFTQGANGSVSIDPVSRSPVYTPNANFNGNDSFTYTISDGHGGTDTAIVNVSVAAENDPPEAADDVITTDEDTAVEVAVLTNDIDAEGDALTVTAVTQGANGTVTIDPVSGNPVYTPNTNFHAADIFTYTIGDGFGVTDTATVTVTINPVNDAPDAVDDVIATNEDTPVTVTALTNDSDADGDAISITTVTQGTNGSVTIDPISGNPVYTPNADYNGPDSFTYTVSDGNGGTDTATVNVSVAAINDGPEAINDTISTNEDTPVTATVLGNDTDPESDPLTITAVTQGSNGSVAIDPVSGSPVYTPDANFNGIDSFTYTIDDGQGGTDTATVNVTISAVNDGPDAVDDTVAATEDTPVTVSALTNDTDAEGDPLTVSAVTQATNGTVTIDPGSGNPVYTPNANFSGVDSFTYTIADGNGGTDTATVNVTVAGINDAPDAVDDTITTNEDTSAMVTVLGNDTDVDGDALSITATTQGANGSVSIDLVTGNPVYTPNANFNGTDTFTYTVSDGSGGTDTATVNVTVTPINDAPDAVDDSITTNEDNPVTVAVLGNDTDSESDPLSLDSFTQATNGTITTDPVSGNPVYTPNANFNGSDSFTYTVSDGNGGTDTATVNITVTPLNDPPEAVDDSVATNEDTAITVAVLGNDTDLDGDLLTITAFTQGTNGSVGTDLITGNPVYTPNANFNGTDSFTYTVSDGNGGTDTATVNLTVHATNDPPTAIDDTYSVNEDATFNATAATGILLNDTDPDGDGLVVNTNPTDDVDNGILVLNADGSFSYTPNANFEGNDSFTYEVSDGNGETDTATVNLTVNNVNDAPTGGNDAFTYTENANNLTGPNLLTNDSDIDPGSNLTVSAVNGVPSNVGNPVSGTYGDLTINTDGTVTFTETAAINQLNQGQTAVESFTYEVSDGLGGTSTASIDITITGVNDAPHIATPISDVTVPEAPEILNVPAAVGTTITYDDLDTITVDDLAQSLIGDGVSLVSATINGGNDQFGTISDITASMPGVVQFEDGIVLTTGSVESIGGPNTVDNFSVNAPGNLVNDPNLGNVHDLAVLRIEFIPNGDTIAGNYVFGSEEYNEYVGTGFNDKAGIFVNGNNVSVTPDGQILSINSINNNVNSDLYIDNDLQDTSGEYYTQMDGFTQTLQFVATVTPGVVNVIEIAIGDSADASLDSWLVVQSDSLRSNGVLVELGDHFDDIDFEDDNTTLTYSVTQSDGSALPTWLAFSGSSLQGNAPIDGNVDLELTVTATDSQGTTHSTNFQIQSEGNIAPVVIDLDGDGAEFDVVSQGIEFDIDGDGNLEKLAWADEDDAVLVYDGNGNGQIDDVSEFAFSTYSNNADATDLEGLRHFDSDDDLMLTANDAEYESFHLWQDSNGDGLATRDELTSLEDSEIESISLVSDGESYTAASGDVLVHGESVVTYEDGSTTIAADASFDYQEGAEAPEVPIEPEVESDWLAEEPLEIIGNDGETINLDAQTAPAPAPAVEAPPVTTPEVIDTTTTAPEAPPAVIDEAASTAAAAAM